MNSSPHNQKHSTPTQGDSFLTIRPRKADKIRWTIAAARAGGLERWVIRTLNAQAERELGGKGGK